MFLLVCPIDCICWLSSMTFFLRFCFSVFLAVYFGELYRFLLACLEDSAISFGMFFILHLFKDFSTDSLPHSDWLFSPLFLCIGLLVLVSCTIPFFFFIKVMFFKKKWDLLKPWFFFLILYFLQGSKPWLPYKSGFIVSSCCMHCSLLQ